MRNLPIHVTLVAAAAAFALGCEDGPNQTYSPAPPGAANLWNSGNADAAVNANAQNFDAGYPTSSATNLCSTDFKRARWAWMLQQPVQPPRFYAGLDMAKDDLWTGLRIEDAENPPADPNSPTGGLCQSTPLGFQGVCPSGFGGCNFNQWGNNGEVGFLWNVTTHLVDQMILNLGYTGTLQTKPYPDHNGESHSWSIQVGDIVRRDGQAFQISWTDSAARRVEITDIFNAIMSTFSVKAGVPFDTSNCTDDSMCTAPGTKSVCECKHDVDATGKPLATCAAGSTGQCGIKNCGTDGNCLILNDGSVTIFGIRPMVIYVQGTAGVPQPALSTPVLFYNFFSKWEPFSYLPQEVKLDADGANSIGTPVGLPAGQNLTCSQQIGLTFDDFRKNCVQVHGDSSNPNGVDAVNLNKVTHSLTHDQEHWTANVLGVNQNFTSLRVANDPDAVVLDSDAPEPGDLAQDWTFDVRARGAVANDWGGDLPGSALVFIEWARLMLADIAAITGKPVRKLGDPACVGFSASGQPNYKNTTGCSGIEGLIIPSYGTLDFSGDAKRPDLNPGANFDIVGWYPSILKPGDITGPLCIDPGTESDCTLDATTSIWGNALLHVTRVLGNGNVNLLPGELRDRRYYYKWFGVAYLKYLKAYGLKSPADRIAFPGGTAAAPTGLGPSDVMNAPVDLEAMFFDYLTQPGSGGAQTFDKFEYVDRQFIGQGVGGTFNWVPWDFEYGTDLKAGNQRYDNFFRRMDREEIAMYSTMLTDKTHTPGQENNVNITNLFGSVLLGGDPVSNVAGLWPTYECAIGQAGDPGVNCGGTNPPLDPNSTLPACGAGGACAAGRTCGSALTFENGPISRCGLTCDFTTYPKSGCASPSQACAGGACLDMMMDLNGTAANAHPLLWYYPGAWNRTPFGRGHSPIKLPQANKRPNLGVAKPILPNFLAGPYTPSPIVLDQTGNCPTGYGKSQNGAWCEAALQAAGGTGPLAQTFNALTPWLEVQPGVGFRIPLDGQRDQQVSTGQLDYTGVLESYIVDYVPYVDKAKASCVADGKCNAGFNCDPASKNCVTNDDTISVQAIEGADFLGEAFLCVDPTTQDVLHVRMYDSVIPILDWLAAHPGSSTGGNAIVPSAQTACQIIIRRTPYDNFIDSITSKTYGVDLNVGGGQGLGRVTDIVLFDTGLIQAL